MRRIILLIVVILAIVYVVISFTEIESIITTLREGNLPFLLVALFFEAVCLLNNTSVYGSLYNLLGLKESRWNLFLMGTAGNFVSLIAPSGGAGALAVFIDSAKKRKLPVARVLVAGMLFLLYEYTSLFLVVLVGFIVMIRRHNLNAGEITAAALLAVIAAGVGLLLYLAYKSTDKLSKLLVLLSRWINKLLHWILHRDVLDLEKSRQFAIDISEGISTLRESKKNLIWPLVFSLNNKAILICVLAFTFLAMGTPFSTGTLIGGFSISQLFYYMSPTPGGVGIVEGIFPVILNILNVPLSQAILITLTYRAITLWLPMVIGLISYRILQKKFGV
jgi:uncharacterized protein (TIRG00374 family)